ncbi:carboxymuconolactone decarboxylase family protein [Desulfatitalea tepidiphila]|uniref:carboxymuconolactone decarboxylase family protein n=1 Tax=Desulfatitalea tepidiphila TaxID=1185843 RepID=UPI0006B49614|nr:carboxymuconolactone decarboxylase family protein [Desulfatitalea tepidiphila]
MKHDYPERHKHLQQMTARLARDLRGPMSAFAQLNGATTAPGALDAKTKQLMALAIGITTHCEGCIVYHLRDAMRAGATREEILETLGVAIMMGGGPAVVYACEALEAMEQVASSGKEPASPDVPKR